MASLITFESFGGFAPSHELENPRAYENEFGAHRAFEEAYDDMVGIIESMADYDLLGLKAVHESKTQGVSLESAQVLYEGAMWDKVKEVFGKIKEYISKLWAKIKAFFKAAAAKIMALFMSGKAFIDKYKEAVKDKGSWKIKVNGYKFDYKQLADYEEADNVNMLKDIKQVGVNVDSYDIDRLKSMLENVKYISSEESLDTLRGSYAGASGPITSDNYGSALFDKYRIGGVKETYTITVSEAVTHLKADYPKVVKKAQTASDKMYNGISNDLKSIENTLSKLANSDKEDTKKRVDIGLSVAREMASGFTKMQSITNQAFSAWKTAANAAVALNKSVIIKALGRTTDTDKDA